MYMNYKPIFCPALCVGSYVEAYHINWVVSEFVEEFDGNFSAFRIILRKVNELNVICLLSYFANLVEFAPNHFRLID